MRVEKVRVVALRTRGLTYTEIQNELNVSIPKGTLSHWCKDIVLSKKQSRRIEKLSANNLAMGRQRALENKKLARLAREEEFRKQNLNLLDAYKNDPATRKIALTILYLAEGHKQHATIVFGNSDPDIIKMFMDLMRTTYVLDESKFRVTVQCRADQNPDDLKNFWSKVTEIPRERFYKPQIDKRTVGKATKKTDYKGVCRIDYLSALIDQELKYIAQMLENR